ncbi:MAG TPA: hypothetical protein VFG33_23225 [Kribbella sp.]|uniref:hypothetical protein n=1 Tax=Kribbella sp. TaxID=1871183 RepID=UPI002D7709FD|nr:hypothetical protein [Kribbella sp.]HET6296315.1 hypothetical protein [Kribbella sp.]
MRQAVRVTAVLAAGGMAVVALTTSSNAQSVNDQSVQAANLSAARHAAAAADDDHSDTVYVTSKAKDGTVSVTIYDPAKGVTPDQLRDKLRRSGVTGVLDKGQEPPTTQPNQKQGLLVACLSFGTAHQWCDRRWNYGGFRDPQVYFLDHTSSAWPVNAAVNVWNEAVGIDSYYRWYTAGCPSGRHCVNVYNGRYGINDWYGQTTWAPGTQGPVTVRLNDSYSLTANEHRTVTCHELGHALSLHHNTASGSCLKSGTYISLRPNIYDYELLKRIYPLSGT